jgi:hypothetical protein
MVGLVRGAVTFALLLVVDVATGELVPRVRSAAADRSARHCAW